MTQHRVCQTSNGFACVHVCDTTLQTSDTRCHFFQSVFHCFQRHMRICQRLTTKSNQICFALFYHQFCKLRFCVTTYSDYRNGYGFFDVVNQFSRETTVNTSRCPHTFIFQMHCSGNMQTINAAAFQIRCNCTHIMVVQTAKHIFCAVDTNQNRNFAFCFCFYFFDDQTGESHSVFKASAEFIDTFVCSGRHEGVYQITMCHMDFYGIYTRFYRTLCCFAIALYQFINSFCRNFFRNVFCFTCLDRRSCLDGSACIFRIAFRTSVLQLNGNFSSFCMNGIADFFQAFNAVVIVQTRFSGTAFCPFMYNSCFNGDQTKLTFCTFCIISNRLFTPCAICVCKVISHRWYDKTVFYNHRTNLDGRKHVFKFHNFSTSFLFLFCLFIFILRCIFQFADFLFFILLVPCMKFTYSYLFFRFF